MTRLQQCMLPLLFVLLGLCSQTQSCIASSSPSSSFHNNNNGRNYNDEKKKKRSISASAAAAMATVTSLRGGGGEKEEDDAAITSSSSPASPSPSPAAAAAETNIPSWIHPSLIDGSAISAAVSLNKPSSNNNLLTYGAATAVLGESALIDGTTGRIYWQGGPSLLSTSLSNHPSLVNNKDALNHLRCKILSCLLFLVVVKAVTSSSVVVSSSSSTNNRILQIATSVLSTISFLLPTFDTWFIVLLVSLYILESIFASSTRKYLENALCSPMDVESYIEQLQREKPTVIWKVRCFHYEKRECVYWLVKMLDLKGWILYFKKKQPQQKQKEGKGDGGEKEEMDRNSLRASLLTKKIVTHTASKEYEFSSWEDKTTTGIWQRSTSPSISIAPFTKITLSKMLVLKDVKSREDYFVQQANFVSKEGRRDEYAEFSTSINVKGFKSKMLAVRPVQGVPSTKLFRIHLYWFFTLIGLTLPFRIWFSKHCDVLRVTVVKETSSSRKKKNDAIGDDNGGTSNVSSSSSWIYKYYPRRWFAGTSSSNVDMGEMGSNNAKTFRETMEQFSLYDAAPPQSLSLSSKANNTNIHNDVEGEE